MNATKTLRDPAPTPAMPALRLYQVPDALQAIDRAIEEAGGEVTPEIEADLAALELVVEEATPHLAALAQAHRRTAEALDQEVQRLKAQRDAHQAAEHGLKEYLIRLLRAAGRERMDAGPLKVRIQANPVAIRWLGPPEEIPEPLRRVRIELDADAARKALEAGALPTLCQVTRGVHLRIW